MMVVVGISSVLFCADCSSSDSYRRLCVVHRSATAAVPSDINLERDLGLMLRFKSSSDLFYR